MAVEVWHCNMVPSVYHQPISKTTADHSHPVAVRRIEKYLRATIMNQNIITKSSIGLVAVFLVFMAPCQAFVLPSNRNGALESRYHYSLDPTHQTIKPQLHAGLFGSQETTVSKATAIPKRIVEIPVRHIKKGGLRMVLGLCLIGLQNTPDNG